MDQQLHISAMPGGKFKVALWVHRKSPTDWNLHVLDLDFEVTLTNAASEEFFARLVVQLEPAQPILPETVTWFLYHTDGYVSTYHGGNDFRHVALENTRLHQPFVEIMRQRRANA